jgi:hypothetical protein
LQSVSDVNQIGIDTIELLVPLPSPFEVGSAVAKLTKCKLPDSDQILAELMQAGGETLQPEISKLVNSIWNKKNCMIIGKVYYFTNLQEKGEN